MAVFPLVPDIGHVAHLGGCLVGWIYARQLGFGNPWWIQRRIMERRQREERLERMSPDQYMVEEIDPILDKIARDGIRSLTRGERRILERGREKISQKRDSHLRAVSWMDRAAAGALDPDRVRNSLTRLLKAWPADFPSLESLIESFPAGPASAAGFAGCFPGLSGKDDPRPGSPLWLGQPEICASERGPRRMELRTGGTASRRLSIRHFRALRRRKKS